ncbi:MAG: hypothetical protein AB8I08_12365 [Sandaracinaceae bacterium]
MVHIEGWDTSDRTLFEHLTRVLRERASVFESHGAVLSLDASTIQDGIELYDDNVLAELRDRGHSIGLHADVGARREPGLTTESMTETLRAMRQRLVALGVPPAHVSGICSHVDWVTAAEAAGFEYVSGVVEYCLMSLPEARRPDGFEGCANILDCHRPYPYTTEERLQPMRVRDGATWIEEDADGGVVIAPSFGVVQCLGERAAGLEIPAGECVLGADDGEAVVALVEEALSESTDPRVHVSMVWSLGTPRDLSAWEAFLEALEPIVRDGRARWMAVDEAIRESGR